MLKKIQPIWSKETFCLLPSFSALETFSNPYFFKLYELSNVTCGKIQNVKICFKCRLHDVFFLIYFQVKHCCTVGIFYSEPMLSQKAILQILRIKKRLPKRECHIYFDQRKQNPWLIQDFPEGDGVPTLGRQPVNWPIFLENNMKVNQKCLAGSPLYPL